MAIENDGYKIYTLLVEYNARTGLPTGRIKPNIPSDPNYIAPVIDHTACPLPSGGPSTMNIIVLLQAGFTITVKLLFGAAILTRNTSGTWTVPERTYDSVIFSISALDTPNYILRVTYDSGTIREVNGTAIGDILLLGPFAGITKLEVIGVYPGDYNDDYNDDYFN